MNNSEYIVKFVTNLPQEFQISNNEIAVEGNMNQGDLSSLMQQLLSAENPDQEYNQQFDFLVNGISLRSSLHELITQNEIATEKTLQIEYLFAVPEPRLKQTINMNDWIVTIGRLNNQILTCLSNGDIVVCSEKGKIVKTYKTKLAKSFTIYENIIISTHWDCSVRVQRITDKLELIAQGYLPSYGECSCINRKNTNEFCVGTANGELAFFDLSTVQQQVIEMKDNFKVHQQQITCCQWIRNSTILTGSYDHSICMFNKRTGSINKQLFAKDSAIIGLCYLEMNQQIVSVHEDGYLKLWDSLSEQLIKIYKSSLSQLTCISVNPNGQIIVTSMDGNAYLWDLRGEVPLYQLNGEGKALACTWIDNKILFGGSTNKLYVYNC
ncbi:unnamed protein product [Paramecium sonneborni]|uniref:NLE domain-containing protein n=1 Tax=Paramecium sonneborni TaxID=65129 RepID=A0A8S1R9D6_9CILI|nr:unnamed protein product [Paramecium sonneborni]